ncbi:uncharacterized protein [Halyomorpha halys]|uniref:uncharacterized protein n=1 Tax=Halyomorpha halys TaxID=286706 RepID=UPI0006D50D02
MAHLAQDRTGEAVIGALRTWFQFYGVPRRISSDGGREFDNATIRGEMKALEVDWHINTPRHPKSRGGIERLHSTLSDHLRVYTDKGLDIKIGTVVYRRLGSNRSKQSRRYEGPFRVITIREHNVVTIESVQEPRKRRKVHVEQLRFPAITAPETPGVPPP